MAKAYRRPVTPAEVTEVVNIGTAIATAHNDPAPGLAGALEAVLLSLEHGEAVVIETGVKRKPRTAKAR